MLVDRTAPTDVLAISRVDYLQHDIPGFSDPRSMAFSSDGAWLYVGGIDEVYIIDAATNKMFYREKIGTQGYPVKVIGVTPDERYVYAIYTCNYDVYRIDTVKESPPVSPIFLRWAAQYSTGPVRISTPPTRT